MTRWLAIGIWVLAAVFAPPTQAQSRFDGWAAVIIAADWRSGDGKPIQAFDNALRDLTAAFEATMVKKTTRDRERHANNPKLRPGSGGDQE